MNKNGIFGFAGITSYVAPNNNGVIDNEAEVKEFLAGMSDQNTLKDQLENVLNADIIFTATPDVVLIGQQSTIALAASISKAVSGITIKKGETSLGTGSGAALQCEDSITPTEVGDIAYTAIFDNGDIQQEKPKIVSAVMPVYFGAGAAYTDAQTVASARKTPAGSYEVTVAADDDYIWIVVPAAMTISKVVYNELVMPMEDAEEVTIDGADYKAYRSTNGYTAGTMNIEVV